MSRPPQQIFGDDGRDNVALAVRTTRLFALALAGAPLLVLALALVIPANPDLSVMLFPVGIVGLAAPVIAYRFFLYRKSKLASSQPESARCGAYLTAFLLALATSEGAAVLGCIGFVFTRHPAALLGVATHLLIVGAIWPSDERVRWFIEPEPA